ncbi:hypothetical protein CDD83_10552 [Cordyceps sp. RAO-2017]|nr:hypothetical protein CDD83_10552 [Cordyceps sp. RAO-2017]
MSSLSRETTASAKRRSARLPGGAAPSFTFYDEDHESEESIIGRHKGEMESDTQELQLQRLPEQNLR